MAHSHHVTFCGRQEVFCLFSARLLLMEVLERADLIQSLMGVCVADDTSLSSVGHCMLHLIQIKKESYQRDKIRNNKLPQAKRPP